VISFAVKYGIEEGFQRVFYQKNSIFVQALLLTVESGFQSFLF
jgi:hypothetical protein